MADAPFRPFETALDEGTALAVLRAATAGADDPAEESPSGPVIRPSGIHPAPRGTATW